MAFNVFLNRQAAKFLAELEPKLKGQLSEKLKELEHYPKLKLDSVKISGEADTFRLRSGDYRALFKVYEKERVIVVLKIDHRRKIYKNLPRH